MAPPQPPSTPPPPLAGDPLTALKRYEAALATLRAGLVDIEGTPSFLMLTNDQLGTETQAKVGSAVDGADELWPLIYAADAAITHSRNYVEANGYRGRHVAETRRLLGERWITVEGVADLLSIAEVLDRFRSRFDAIRGFVSEVNDLWLDVVPRIDAARATLTRLDAEAEALGVPEPLIGRARALADDLEQRLVTDPLGVVPGDGPQLDAQVAAAAEQIASLRSGHDNLEDDLGVAEQLLASLRVLRAKAEAAASETKAKVRDADGLVRVPTAAVIDGPKGLAERLDEVFMASSATWSQRRALLDGWLKTARKLEAQLTRAEAANRSPLDRREELRGRLRAYRAKMAAIGKAEDLDVTDIVDRARSELFTAPTDLNVASEAIDELARRLRT